MSLLFSMEYLGDILYEKSQGSIADYYGMWIWNQRHTGVRKNVAILESIHKDLL